MKPLDGIRVLEVGQVISAPICSYQLHMLGAEVIKIERPGGGDDLRYYDDGSGPPAMGLSFIAYNAGKRSVQLDIASQEGRESLLGMVRKSDVVIENLRPGAMVRLNLGWEDMRRENDRLVYCSISGFGQDGAWKDLPAYDHILQAMSGLMSLNGDERGPLRLPVPLVDIMCGTQAALAIVSALFQRDRDGRGRRIDAALLDSALFFMATPLASCASTGRVPARQGNLGFRPTATSGVYQTADGHVVIGCNQQAQFERLCSALDLERLLDDPRFATHEARMTNRGALIQVLTDQFGQRDAADVEKRCAAANVPAVMVRDMGQFLQESYGRERGVIVDVPVEGDDRRFPVVGPLFKFDRDGPAIEGPVPALGSTPIEQQPDPR